MRSCLNLLLFLTFASHVAVAAEPPATLRFLAQDRPEVFASVRMVAGEEASEAFDLPTRNLSPTLEFPKRAFFLRSAAEAKIRIGVTLPERGKGFVVLLLADKESGLKPVIIPTDLPRFKVGDIYLHNTTGRKLVGKIGSTAFSVDPLSSEFIRPAGDKDGIFDVAIGAVHGDAIRPVTTSRWPEDNSHRTYLLFFEDRKSGRVKFRAVEEYVAPKD